ncbi:MAG: NADH-ubiquinone oxidoreductase [Actinomycetia bacterium]|nr:NADH-ubiquinone oxidoreductase [Actinomycetes bacterium]
MSPWGWVIFWIALGAGGLSAAGLAERRGRATGWLVAALLVGAGGFFLMTPALGTPGTDATLALPAPWPTLALRPLPLAPLWSTAAGLLFAAAALGTAGQRRRRQILYALLPLEAGVGIYLWSGDGFLLVMAWEFVSAVTYLGLVTSRRGRSVWQTGWVLLALSEAGGMMLLLAVAWLSALTAPTGLRLHDAFVTAHLPHRLADGTVIMVLGLVAFGVKAGLFPVMIWMPLAEPEAPGVVAGMFSGLLPPLAVSGILALDRLTHPGMGWGITLVVLGVLGALTGALYSVMARRAKAVLAYSTLEVLGLVFAALGIWQIASRVSPGSIAGTLALDGAVVLLAMHAGAKFLAFAATDGLGRYGQTLDRLGGLLRRTPRAGRWALVAVLALAGFPPLGGYVGEWLLLESLLKPLGPTAGQEAAHLALLAAGGGLALAVGLGVASYLRWYGFIYLGPEHVPPDDAVHDLPPAWAWAMGLAAILPVLTGPAVPWFLPWLNRTLRPFLTTPATVFAPTFTHPQAVQPLVDIGANLVPAPGTVGTILFPQGFSVGDPYVLTVVAGILVLLVGGVRARNRRHPVRFVAPWTGGAESYRPRTSFSAEGFVHPIRLAFAAFYGLERERVERADTHFYRHTIVWRVEEHIYLPLLAAARWIGAHVRRVQSGQVGTYLLLVVGGILAALAVAFLR